MNTIGKNIRQLRQKNGWNQGQVAQRLAISIPAYSKIETGVTDINISRLTQMAFIFNVSTMDIMSETGKNPESINHREIDDLTIKIALRENEVIKLQKKIIDLYEEIRG